MNRRDEQDHDQDAEPSLNAPEEGRPDGVVHEDETEDDEDATDDVR